MAGLAGVLRDLGTPYMCVCPEKCRTDSRVLSSCVMACPCTPLSIAAICCAGSASPSPTLCAAIEHLTRSRAISRIPERFSCRFQSPPVRACPRSCLYANWVGLVLEHASRVLGYIRRPVAPCPPRPRRFRLRYSGSVLVNERPCGGSLCGHGAICPEIVITKRPDACRVPTGHLAFGRHDSRHY